MQGLRKQNIIYKLSNGEAVDLTKLNKKAIRRLHYEEERKIAERIRKLPPFSKERQENTKLMYQFACAVMPMYLPETELSYGANDSSVEVVCDFLRADKSEKTLYEAGVGMGFSCKRFVQIHGVRVKGCDVIVSEPVKELMTVFKNISVDEDTLFNSLSKLEDNSIDYFYADNVIEHLLTDEFPQTLQLISRKVKKDGLLFMVIPNKLIGPCDVSMYFKKRGEKAEGSHFMEMSYRETISKFRKVGIVPGYITWRSKNRIRYIKDKLGIMNCIKVGIEVLLSFWIKHLEIVNVDKFFYNGAYTYYIFVNKN